MQKETGTGGEAMKDLSQYGNRREGEWEILPWLPDPRPPFKIWAHPVKRYETADRDQLPALLTKAVCFVEKESQTAEPDRKGISLPPLYLGVD